jgi:hypothetical protein
MRKNRRTAGVRPSHRPSRREALARGVNLAVAAVAAGASLALPLRRAWGAPDSAVKLRAGAAIADITPEPGIRIDGVIARSGPGKGAHDPLHARTLALDDGTTKLTLTICDVRMIGQRICDEAKALASKRTGIPAANMLVAATHTHGTPTPVDLYPNDERYMRWQQLVIERVAESIARAVDNLAPASIGWASVRKPDYTFNRRWRIQPDAMLPNPWGEKTDKVLTNPSVPRDKLVEPAGPVDDELTVVYLRHADGRPLSVLANYSTHYVGDYADQLVSSDYYGIFGNRVKELLAPWDERFVAMMFNGTSGNLNTINFAVPRDADRGKPWQRMARVGEDMAQTALKLVKQIDRFEGAPPLAVATSELDLAVRKPDEKRLAWAKSTLANPPAKGWPLTYARETGLLAKYPDRVKIPMQAMRIGGLAIAGMPCEVFAETGLEIKQRSQHPRTINIGLANGYYGYLPTPEQHALGGYETWPATISFLEVDASTKIRDTELELLAKVK